MGRFWIDVENSSGTKYGSGPITSGISWENDNPIDRAGSFRFSMPAADPNAALLVAKRVVRCYAIIDGVPTVQGAGIIDNIAIRISDPAILEISGGSIERELTYRSVGFLAIDDGSGGGATTALADIIAFAPSGWTVDAVNGYATTSALVYADFGGESVLSAFIKTGEHIGEHFYFTSNRKIVWIRTDQTASGVRAVQAIDPVAAETATELALITSLEEVQDSFDLLTRLYPFGSGTGEARLTLGPTSKTAPAGYTLSAANNYLENDAAVSTYGRIERYLSFKEIRPISNTNADQESAADALYDAAFAYLSRYKDPHKFYRLEVAKLDQVLTPGDTIRVVYSAYRDGYQAINIDADLYILQTTTRIDQDGIRTVALNVATIDRWPKSNDEMLAGNMDEGRVFEAHPQMNANSYVTGYREPMDDGTAAVFDFWLGAETVTVNQVSFRFRIDPLRSTVKSVAGTSSTTADGDWTSATSADGSWTGSTSDDGGAYSTSDGSHQHLIEIFDGVTPNYTISGWYEDSGSVGFVSTGSGGTDVIPTGLSDSHVHSIPDHTHDISVTSHTHSVSGTSHTHDVTPLISTSYGLFEEIAGNTLAESDLVYKVNGGADLGASVVSLGSGWYELDITSSVSDANYRPVQTTNQLEISTATAKTALITGQLVVRTVIQATALT